MKSLKKYIEECNFATPMNTVGMGNPQCPTDTNVGSEPIIGPITIDKTKKLKKIINKNKKEVK